MKDDAGPSELLIQSENCKLLYCTVRMEQQRLVVMSPVYIH